MSTPSANANRPACDLSVDLAGIALKNPVIAASGTFGYGVEFEDVVHLSKLGGFVVKGLSREPMIGNPPPRLWETAAGMLNAIGLQNIGARAFLDEKLPKLRQIKDIVVFANVFGYTREDYERTIEILNEGEGIAAYELNVSCPNTEQGGLQFGADPRALDEVVTTAKRVSRRPLIVKLSPNVTSIAQMAYVAQESGADAISLINTFVAMAIDPETRKPRIANVTAGLSGPAIKPIAVRMVYDAAHAVKIPVI
ncbi:MAG: dihydroorotate dehydrogenase, partial [Candidatus Sulfotelmatobacter sp.]